MKKFISFVLVFSMLASLVVIPANAQENTTDWATVIDDDFNYDSSTVITTAYTDALPYKKDGDSNFNPGFLSYDGVNALKLQYDSSTKPTAHQNVYTKLSSSGLKDGIIEYKYSINIPKNAANTLGGTYNTSKTYIWESLSNGSSDVFTLRFIVDPSSAISVGYVANNEANANITTKMPFDTWATITAYLDTHSRTFKFNVAWNGTVQATSETFEWRNNSKGNYPTDIHHYIQKTMPNVLYYLSDLSVKTLSSQNVAKAEFDAITVPSNPTQDFTVPVIGSVYGSAINWASNSAALTVSGANVTLNPQGSVTNATLTASVVRNGNTYTRDFVVTVPRDSGIANIAFEDFEYGAGATIGTSTTQTMPWYVQNSNLSNFTPSIGGDANNNYLQLAVNPTLTDISNHKSVQRMFYTDGADGIVNYSLKVYIPSGVDNGAEGTYNTGGHNLWISLIDSGNREMLTYTAIIKNGAITIQHVPTTTVEGGSYAETGVKSSFTFKTDKWITFNATVDVSEHSYVFTATDGTNTFTSDKSTIRNYQNGLSGYTGKPAGVRVFVEKSHANTLGYVDDIVMDVMNYKYAAQKDIEKIAVPEMPVVDFTLPVIGEEYGSTISWASNSDALAVDASGNATLNPQAADTSVTLTATITKGSYTTTQTYSVTVKNKSYIAQEAMKVIIENITFKDISGYKEYYIKDNFTPSLDLPDGVSATYSSNSSALVIENGTAKLVRGAGDTNVDFTVTLTDVDGNSVSKTFDVLVPGNGILVYEQGFDDASLKDKTVSNISGWSVGSESTDTSVTGTTSYIRNHDGDGYLDTQRYRAYTANQYAYTNINREVTGDAVLQFRTKFTGDEDYWWVFYVNGKYINADGSVTSDTAIAQFSFDTIHKALGVGYKSGINGPTPDATFDSLYEGELPFDEWFNFRAVFHTEDCTYDLYINDTKLTSSPIKTYNLVDGTRLVKLTGLNIGASRGFEWTGNYYVDDISVRSLAEDEVFLQKAKENLALSGSNIMFDMTLPQTAGFDTTVSWASKNGYINAQGKVSRPYGLGNAPETLTATIERNGSTVTKDFALEVVKQPYYEIEHLVFDDGAGKEVLAPVPGGTLKSISVLQNQEVANAKIYVGIYNINSLVTVKEYNVADGDVEINYTLPNVDDLTVKAFVWNSVFAPVAYEYAVSTKPKDDFTIYVAGDSICATTNKAANHDPATTQYGWGEVVGQLFDDSYVTVENHAVGGRSSRSFIDEGRLQNIIDKIQPGDYLFVKFGHNDQKPAEPEKYTTLGENGTYRKYLQMYVDAARDKGAIPVMVTSIYRRRFSDGVSQDTQCGYPEEMKAYAATVNVPVIDLHQKTGAWLTKIGETESAKYFMTHAGDNTHLTYYGAVELNRLAKEEMVKLGLSINTYFAENQ